MTIAQDLREQVYLLGQNFPGYEDVLTQSLFALVTREHMLWYSKPGRAKTQVAGSLFGIFANAPVFRIQLTKDTMKDELFGNVVADDFMKTGREVYNLENGIVEAVFAYLDEFFDGSDFLLRALLNLLNEREFHAKDMGVVASPLHSVIATTNFYRNREATGAVLDRFMCKAVLHGIDGVADNMRATRTYLTYTGKSVPFEPLDYQGLDELASLVEAPEEDGGIAVSPGMRLLHVLLISEFQRRRVEAATKKWHVDNPDAVEGPDELELAVPDISPRTMVKLLDFVRASAALSNRSAVVPDDIRGAVYGLVTIGDGSGDQELWSEICNEFLGLSNRQIESLEKLGVLTDQVSTLKAERSQTGTMELKIGGQVYTAMSLTGSRALDIVSRNNHPVLALAKQQLGKEISGLSGVKPARFDLLKGW